MCGLYLRKQIKSKDVYSVKMLRGDRKSQGFEKEPIEYAALEVKGRDDNEG